jgi:hypothetical protein
MIHVGLNMYVMSDITCWRRYLRGFGWTERYRRGMI